MNILTLSRLSPFSVKMDLFGISSIVDAINDAKDREWTEEENQKNRDFNAQQSQMQRDWSSDEASKARDFNEYMWNKSADYNSEQSRMRRLIEAGVNPTAAAMGLSGTSSAIQPVTSSIPSGSSASASSMQANPRQAPASRIAFDNLVAQRDLIQSQAKLNNANAEKAEGERRVLAIDEKSKPILYDWQVKEMKAKVYDLQSSGELQQTRAFQIDQLTPLLRGKTYGEIQQLASVTNKYNQDIAESKKRVDSIQQSISESKKRVSQIEASIKVLNSEAERNKVEKDLFDAKKKLVDQERDLRSAQTASQQLSNRYEWFLQHSGFSKDVQSKIGLIYVESAKSGNTINSVFGDDDFVNPFDVWLDVYFKNSTPPNVNPIQ